MPMNAFVIFFSTKRSLCFYQTTREVLVQAHNTKMTAEEAARLSATHRASWNARRSELPRRFPFAVSDRDRQRAIRDEERYVGTHARANLELLSRNRLIDMILEFDSRRVGNGIRMETIRRNRNRRGPGVPLRYRRWTPQANSVTTRTMNRLRAEVETLQVRLLAEQEARETLERANS
jgi:hypothetical protein